MNMCKPTNIWDKNDVEICERDILFDPSWWWGSGYVFLNRGKCGPSTGDSVMAYILSQDIKHPLKKAFYNIWNGKEVEIIGNIDDTPELLGCLYRPTQPPNEYRHGQQNNTNNNKST